MNQKLSIAEKQDVAFSENGANIKIAKGKNASINIKLRASEGTDVKTKELHPFDRDVSAAIASLFYRGSDSIEEEILQKFFTINDIIKMLTGNDRGEQNEGLKNEIHQSLIRLQNIEAIISYNELKEIGAYKENIDMLNIYSRYKRLLNISRASQTGNNGITTYGYVIDDIPLLCIFGYAFKHLS